MSKPPIRPVVWRPEPATARSRRRSGPQPFPPTRFLPLPGVGPEDVVVEADGRLLCGVEDGRILRVDPGDGAITTIGDTGGRPLGLELLADGDLVVCDERRGLLRLATATGVISTLVREVDGAPLRLCSNAAAASDGSIYFTESSRRFGLEHYRADLLEHRGTGRLMRRSPEGRVQTLLEGLHFANGVALTAAEDAVIVAETGAYRVTRVELSGPLAGQRRVLATNLPGFPDNISRGSDGLTWVAMAAPRNPLLDRLSSANPLWRRLTWALPERVQPAAVRTVWAIALDESGRVVRDLQAERDDYHFVTGVAEHHGRLYLASLLEPGLLEVDLFAA